MTRWLAFGQPPNSYTTSWDSTQFFATAETIFNNFRDKELRPAYLADAKRVLLDRRVVCDLLGFDETINTVVRRLSEKWCAEPWVHGGKSRPPKPGWSP